MAWITAVLIVLAACVAVPCAVFFVQCLAAFLPSEKPSSSEATRPRVGVLVPAHNEEAVLRSTLESIRGQLTTGDRLLVIADNCTDSTAKIASDCRAEVIERTDSVRRGKGYALQCGLDRLAAEPPEVVVVIDADCQLMPGCLDALARRVAKTLRPVQACYLMTPPPEPRAVDVISSLAIVVKNRVRPLGMSKMAQPCLITGSGSAFPWKALQVRSFSGGNIVEDMQLAVDLALAGFAPRYCDEAVVLAALPDRHSAFLSQRRRWEHGHLETLFSQAPRLLAGFFRTGRFELVAMTADLSVPPLSLLVAIDLLTILATLGWAVFHGNVWPFVVAACATLMLAISVGAAWWGFARDRVPFRTLLTVPGYVLAKLPLYATFLYRRERAWVRTTRTANVDWQENASVGQLASGTLGSEAIHGSAGHVSADDEAMLADGR
jgi:cellulose synthase/poly-beta-1,6-N-acetylglucosamine synthase-like glycosyltransferase